MAKSIELISEREIQTRNKAISEQALNRSVVIPENKNNRMGGGTPFVISFAAMADEIPSWGKDIKRRDIELRKFWPTESLLASALYSSVIRNAGFTFTLEGPDTLVDASQSMLNMADRGRGWWSLMLKIGVDLYSQDNGAIIEIIRSRPVEDAPTIGLGHLDSFRCQRTGDPLFPIIYTDRLGKDHLMPHWSVYTLEEFPSPIESMFDAQVCAVSRVLRAAQILRDIAVYKHEKVSGKFNRAVHLVSGVTSRQVTDALEQHLENSDNKGQYRYIQPLILGSIDPNANVGVETIELASLPDAFDEDTTFRWYVAQIALAFGSDYQDFAPLPGGNLGSGQQSEILHRKTRGKGPGLFMKLIENMMNNTGILPNSVVFSYSEQDVESAQEQARLKGIRAKTRREQLESGEITIDIARELALEQDDLTQEQFNELLKQPEEEKRAFGARTIGDDRDMDIPKDRDRPNEEGNRRSEKPRVDTDS